MLIINKIYKITFGIKARKNDSGWTLSMFAQNRFSRTTKLYFKFRVKSNTTQHIIL